MSRFAATAYVALSSVAVGLCYLGYLGRNDRPSIDLKDDGKAAAIAISPPKKFAEFVAAVYMPTVVAIPSSSADVNINELIEETRSEATNSLSALFHALPLFGTSLTVPAPTDGGTSFRAIDVILDQPLARKFFPQHNTLTRTRFGVRVPEANAFLLGTQQSHVQAHRGQALAILAQLGVPLCTPLIVGDGNPATVSDLFADLLANFHLEGEIYWDAVAIALYLPEHKSWKNRLGDSFTLDDLTVELMSRTYFDSSCAGTHILIALATIMRVDQLHAMLLPTTRQALEQRLRATIEKLSHSQLPRGGWQATWFVEDEASLYNIPYHTVLGDEGIMMATGHHLEWMVLCPESWFSDCHDMFERATLALAAIINKHIHEPRWIKRNYCPLTHAIKAVRVFTKA